MKTKLHTVRVFELLGTLAVVVGLLTICSPARAVPVQFGTNYYEFVSDVDVSWVDASSAAAGMTYLGVNGHLATVTSIGENSFLAGIVTPYGSFAGSWLGGTATGWVVGPETGQSYSYTNWGGIEPNNPPSNAYMNVGVQYAGIDPGQWADAANGISSGNDPIKGYFVEYEISATPLPGALPLFATGLGALGFIGWRKKRKAAALAA